MVNPFIKTKYFRKALAFLIFSLLFLPDLGCKEHTKKIDQTVIPEFNIKLLNKNSYFSTKEISSGDPFVLFYFGPFCEPSRQQMDNIIKNIASFENFKFYLISDGDNYDTDLFYKHYKLKNYSNIVVGLDQNNFFPKYYHVTGTPCIVIYGKDRKIKDLIRGGVYSRQIKKIGES